MQEDTTGANKSSEPPKKPFIQFLIESDIKLLVFIGKSTQYFGKREVICFFLGAITVYIYALFQPLPWIEYRSKE